MRVCGLKSFSSSLLDSTTSAHSMWVRGLKFCLSVAYSRINMYRTLYEIKNSPHRLKWGLLLIHKIFDMRIIFDLLAHQLQRLIHPDGENAERPQALDGWKRLDC